jgi:hypothetical protein
MCEAITQVSVDDVLSFLKNCLCDFRMKCIILTNYTKNKICNLGEYSKVKAFKFIE